MTTAEALIAKQKAEQAIFKILTELSKSTELQIDSIDLTIHDAFGILPLPVKFTIKLVL